MSSTGENISVTVKPYKTTEDGLNGPILVMIQNKYFQFF